MTKGISSSVSAVVPYVSQRHCPRFRSDQIRYWFIKSWQAQLNNTQQKRHTQ